MWNYKIAMATFRTSQCQDGDEVLKCCEWRCQGTKRHFRKPEHMKEHIKRDSNTYFVENFFGALRHTKNTRLLSTAKDYKNEMAFVFGEMNRNWSLQ